MPFPTAAGPAGNATTGKTAKLYVKVGSAPTVSDIIPDLSDLNFAINGQTINTEVYGSSAWVRSDKTSLSATLSFGTLAYGNNSVVAPIITAAKAAGGSAKALFVLELPDGGYWSGQVVLSAVTNDLPIGGAFKYQFSGAVDGEPAYQAPGA